MLTSAKWAVLSCELETPGEQYIRGRRAFQLTHFNRLIEIDSTQSSVASSAGVALKLAR